MMMIWNNTGVLKKMLKRKLLSILKCHGFILIIEEILLKIQEIWPQLKKRQMKKIIPKILIKIIMIFREFLQG